MPPVPERMPERKAAVAIKIFCLLFRDGRADEGDGGGRMIRCAMAARIKNPNRVLVTWGDRWETSRLLARMPAARKGPIRR